MLVRRRPQAFPVPGIWLSDTAPIQSARSTRGCFITTSLPHGHLFEPYRLLRGRTHLLADNAGHRMGIRETSALVEHGGAGADPGFLLLVQSLDGSGGADLPAQSAAIFAIADARDEHRRPYPFTPRFKEDGLEAVGSTDFHAFPAFHAPFQEFPLFERTGRPYQFRVLGFGVDEGHRSDSDLREVHDAEAVLGRYPHITEIAALHSE